MTATLPKGLGFGAAHVGSLFAPVSEVQAQATLDAAWDAGIRYFDTAPWYGHGLSELRLGRLLRAHPGEAFVSTKVGRVYDPLSHGPDHRAPWTDPCPFGLGYDYTAGGFAQSLAQSRLRLGIGRIDALVIHDLDRPYHGEAFEGHVAELMSSGLAWLHEIKAQGEIGAIGMGINAAPEFHRFATEVDVDFFLVAMPYTLLDQEVLDGPMQACLDRGIRVVIGAPYASGLLIDPDAPGATYAYEPATPGIRAKARAIAAVCARHGTSLPSAALHFPLLHPAVDAVIPGAKTPDEAKATARAFAAGAPPALWRDLLAEGLIRAGSVPA